MPRRALAALALIVPAPTIGVVAAMIVWPGLVGQAIFFACKVWMAVLPAGWRRWVEGQPWTISRPRHGGFGTGIAVGLAIAVIIGLAYVLGTGLIDRDEVREAALRNGIGTPLRYGLAIAYWILVNSLIEEYVYRWFIFRQCEVLMPTWLAVVAAALIFTVHHIVALAVQFDWAVSVLGSLGVFIGGLVWSWLYARYRSIWPGYVSHAIVDVAVFAVGAHIIFGPLETA